MRFHVKLKYVKHIQSWGLYINIIKKDKNRLEKELFGCNFS